MKVRSVDYVKSAMYPEDYPKDRRPEVAFVGRSNVGKSSLMNRLFGRRGLAKTSSTPGKTQTVNFFDLNEQFYFVDLPGYGFAKVSKEMRRTWGETITRYLENRDSLRLVVLLLDMRHKPSVKDHDMLHLLDDAEIPVLAVATKADKVKRGQRAKAIKVIREELQLPKDAVVLPVSAESGDGIKELWGFLDDILTV